MQGLDGWAAWQQIDDIYAAAPSDRSTCSTRPPGSSPSARALSGPLPLGAAVRASYCYGGGLQGQVAIGAINKSAALPGGFSVTNPVPTWGASDGESVSDGEAAITRWLRHRDRLVTADDFSDLTGVHRGSTWAGSRCCRCSTPTARPQPSGRGW